MGNAASSNDQINNPQVLLSNYIDSFGYDSVSKSQYIYSSEEGLNSYQGVNYLLNNSCNLKILKMNFVSRVTQHFESINNDIFHLLTVIDSLISINTEKILNLNSSNRKVSENMSKLVLDSQGEFSKACDGIKISNECLDIIKDVIKGWNAHVPNHAIGRISTFEKFPKISEPLSYCNPKTGQVNYYDWSNNTYKSFTIDGLNILKGSRSISIDHKSILLNGGWPDGNILKTNENMSKVCKIDLETKSFQTLASMKTGRADFCMTYLDSYYYVFGGLDYQKHKIKKCERYSLENDKWQYIGNLNKPRNAASCASVPIQNCIYIIGGKDANHQLNGIIEKYDANINKWFVLKIKRPILRIKLACCKLPDSSKIFIFGGEDLNEKWQSECYFYEYETNQVADANPFFSNNDSVLSMPVIKNKKIYCCLKNSYLDRKVSVYDIESGFWSIEP